MAKSRTHNLYSNVALLMIFMVGNVLMTTSTPEHIREAQEKLRADEQLHTAAHEYAVKSVGIEEPDERAVRIDAYFEARNMPLAGYGQDFIDVADSCGMDWRLLPAIGVRESSGGKHMMNNNPFGWGSARIPFTDFSHAIAEVGAHICGNRETTARYYKDQTVYKKLWYYNGTVMPSYPNEVIAIMEKF